MLKITNTKIIRNNQLEDVKIIIEEGKIKNILSMKDISPSTDKEIDLEGRVTFPGFIDPHVHFDDPGFTEREDFETGTKGAAAGGITTIIDMPCTSSPQVTNGDNFDYKLKIVEKKAYVDFAFWGGVTPEQVKNGEYKKSLKELHDRGIAGVKFYTISGMKLYPRMPIPDMDKAFRFLKELGLICAVHAEDYYLADYYSNKMISQGRRDVASWCEGRTYEAEPKAIWSVVGVSGKVGNKLHIVHLSTCEGLNVIRWAKDKGMDISTETCPQYLLFNIEDFKRLGAILKVAPPLREKRDNEALWNGLKDHSISFICTDHAAGKFPLEKSYPSIWDNYAGIPGTQLMVPVMFHYGYQREKLSLQELQEIMSENAAKRYGLYPQKGTIQVGSDADLTVMDLEKEWEVDVSKLKSKGKYSVFSGQKIKGKVFLTMVRGKIVFKEDEGILGTKGYGQLVMCKNK